MGGRGSGVDRNDFCTIFPHAGRGGLHKMKNFVRLIALLAVLFLITYVPSLVLWLPDALLGVSRGR